MVSLFRKTVISQSCNCTKKDSITGVFLWIYLCKHIFSFLFFHFKKDKQPPEIFCEKKRFLKNLANFTGKHLCWSLFLMKLQVFKSTYFTTASKKINICLIVEVLLFHRIKLLNSNVNKKKIMCKNLTSEVMWHENCRRQASILTYRYVDLIGHLRVHAGAIPCHSCPGLFSQW